MFQYTACVAVNKSAYTTTESVNQTFWTGLNGYYMSAYVCLHVGVPAFVCLWYPSVCPVMKAVSIGTNPTISASSLNDRDAAAPSVMGKTE